MQRRPRRLLLPVRFSDKASLPNDPRGYKWRHAQTLGNNADDTQCFASKAKPAPTEIAIDFYQCQSAHISAIDDGCYRCNKSLRVGGLCGTQRA